MLTIPNIRFIGVEDDNLDLFEAQYPLTEGISYNSYLIDDGVVAVIDSVDTRRKLEWFDKLETALSGRQPDFLIVQHVEPDHSSSIGSFMQRYPQAKIVATAKAVEFLGEFFDTIDFSNRSIIVKDGDTLTLKDYTLHFVTAPMVHWPEVMMTFEERNGILFSADAFGSFAQYSSAEAWDNEARRYYCNIVGKYGANVQSAIKKLAKYDIKVIAPLHGPVLADNLSHYFNLYDKWSTWQPEVEGVLVAYASVYGGTATAARKLANMLEEEGAGEVVPFDLCRHDVSYAVAESFRLSRLVLCSITYDGGLFPAMSNLLHHLAAKGFRNRPVGIIENGTWAPVAARQITAAVEAMRDMVIVPPTVTLRSRMHAGDIDKLRSLAHNLSKE